MFSQLRNAVEQLAQPIRDASSPENHSESTARSGSLDIQAGRSTSPLSSTELAESALSSLRKSLASQRSGSPLQSTKTPGSPSPPESTRPRKSNLEERLRRATFAIGDASGSPTPTRSSRVASPSPMSSDRKPMPTKVQEQSPYSTPLPSSPMVAPASEVDSKVEQPSKLSLEEKSTPSGETKPVDDSEAPSIVTSEVLQTTPSSEKLVEEKETSQKPPVADAQSTSVDTQPSSADILTPETTTSPSLEKPTEEKESFQKTFAADVQSYSADVQSLSADAPPPSADVSALSVAEAVKAPVEEEIRTSSPTDSTIQDGLQAPTLGTEVASITEDIFSGQNTPSSANSDSVCQEPSPINEEVVPKEEISIKDAESPSKQEIAIVENVVVEESVKNQGHAQESAVPPPFVDNSADLESLQARLKQVEQRFSDVSTSFKRLQAEKLAADAILQESTPLESIKDVDGLREFFKNLKTKDDVFQDEIKRLNQKLELQEDRIEELRDTHRLESHSRSDEVKKLKTQLDETEALFQAAQRATSHAEEVAEKHKEEIAQLKIEVEKSKNTAKEEEEKRVKAISLLKTVRQKLVKAEKDKEDVVKEMAVIKERETGDKDKEQAERLKFQREIENLTTVHEQATANMRMQFNKDYTSMQERYKQEISALRGQFELDIASAKATHTKELSQKSSQIATLENSLNNVTRDKNAFFDQLQLRQAELESAQAHLESITHQNTEFQFQLREANDRVALLKEECAELLREQESRTQDPVTSADDIARMVSATETKYEAKLSEMKRNLAILEKERHESEADWSRKLKENVKELDDLKRILGSAAKTREADENIVANLKAELAQAQKMANSLEQQISELPLLRERLNELDKTLKEQENESNIKILVLEKQIEETKAREAQVKQSNKTLREELRKVQSSAALLERQRNPGVGYWTTRVSESNGSAAEPRTPQPETPTRVSSPTPSTTTSNKNEEEVNLEYLRNVILQFLEHKEMRPNLVKVLSIILHFTPQETRRLIAKV